MLTASADARTVAGMKHGWFILAVALGIAGFAIDSGLGGVLMLAAFLCFVAGAIRSARRTPPDERAASSNLAGWF